MLLTVPVCFLLAYETGDIQAERRLRNTRGEVARSLERNPQLESILAARKSAQFGLKGFGPDDRLVR